MNRTEKLLEKLKVIDKVEDLYETSSKNQLYIKDVDDTSILTDTCGDFTYCFSVVNQSVNDIHFIPLDGDGIIGRSMKCCDAVIFDNTHFSFLELKLNATSLKRRAIYENRMDAVKQITSAILFFNDKLNSEYEGLELEAIIATPKTYPRANASWGKIAAKFTKDNNGIKIFEATEKVYQN